MTTIDGIGVTVTPRGVVVAAVRPLTVISSAVVGGGLGRARSIVNVHVDTHAPLRDPAATIDDFCRTAHVSRPVVGLLTAAWTDEARIASASVGDVTAMIVTTVGLSNRIAAGLPAAMPVAASTINIIAVVDADVTPAALVNLALTVTEVKTAMLRDADVRCDDGTPATGTSTDAVVVAATGRGPRAPFGGPATPAGAAVARAARTALSEGIADWLERRR